MRKAYKIVRNILFSAVLGLIAIYLLLYLALSLPPVQTFIKNLACTELNRMTGGEFSVREVSIAPFNRVILEGVSLKDPDGKQVASIEKLGAGIAIWRLITERRIIITFGEILGMNARITQVEHGGTTNIQFLIDAFSPKDKNKPPAKFDLQINNIVLRKCNVSFDRMWLPRKKDSNVIDFNHLEISDLAADLRLPVLRNEEIIVDLRRLSLKEHAGFFLESMSGRFIIKPDLLAFENLRIKLPGTQLEPSDVSIPIKGFKSLDRDLRNASIKLALTGAEITPSDFSAFLPVLANYPGKLLLTLDAFYEPGHLDLQELAVLSPEGLSMNMQAKANGIDSLAELNVTIQDFKLKANGETISLLLSDFMPLPQNTAAIIRRLGDIRLNLRGEYSARNLLAKLWIESALGTVRAEGAMTGEKLRQVKGYILTPGFDIGRLLDNAKLGQIAINASGETVLGKGIPDGQISFEASLFEFNGYSYRGITANLLKKGSEVEGNIDALDDNVNISIAGYASILSDRPVINLTGSVHTLKLSTLNLAGKYNDVEVSGDFDVQMAGNNLDNLDGHANFTDIHFSNSRWKDIYLDHFNVSCNHSELPYRLSIESDPIDASIEGDFNLTSLPASMRGLAARFLPSLVRESTQAPAQQYAWNVSVNHDSPLLPMLHLPVTLLEDLVIEGQCDTQEGTASMRMNIPYLQQGKDKLIRNTVLDLDVDSTLNLCRLTLGTELPSKKGDIAVKLTANAANDSLHTDLSWNFNRPRSYKGNISLSTLFGAAENGGKTIDVSVNPSSFYVNDTVWNINKARLSWFDRSLRIDSICVHRPGQLALINGLASDSPDDLLKVDLKNIDLDYVFEALNINYVTFGGRASGHLQACALFSRRPRLFTDDLVVDGLTYNNSLLGDALIRSHFDTDAGAVHIAADIAENFRPTAKIDGDIFVTRDSLSIGIDANKVNVGFLQPFMAAFSSEVSGRASGLVKLYGTFKDINLAGKVFADSLKIKIDVTNTYYTASDSVVIDPGIIHLKDITLYDRDGHTALLNGEVRHNYFHEPTFDFTITKARNFLCYDTDSRINPTWWGTIYGNGSGSLHGVPGYISAVVDMSSAPGSTFTFALNDQEEAADYEFITFSDKRKEAEELRMQEQLKSVGEEPEFLSKFLKKRLDAQQSSPTRYDMDLRMRATTDARVNIIMDPVAGDHIEATGTGALRMTYNSDDELNLYGTYTLAQGYYNFTLQDLIVRDFRIREGSKITFNGDPLQAMLSLTAAYKVNTSLTELDKSFASDRDLNRTNVPVEALLKVDGEMQRPEITFDIDFPTLSTDVASKVKSIISTSDMMNRQIIYLLALNRFYTPDYMNTDGNNNELAAVASTTLSTQLGQMLGQLAPGWSFSPYFRSEKGDFSDMEVDLALSSALFNNRLLLNGNLGYRDRATSSTTFVGDFDIEYLLNPAGTLRLKAYNHFNDQNYYLRQALTTQGIGIVYKRDFNRFLPGIFRKKKKQNKKAVLDTTGTAFPK